MADASETSAFVLECSWRKTRLDFCHHTMFNKALLLNGFVTDEMQPSKNKLLNNSNMFLGGRGGGVETESSGRRPS